MGSMVHKRLARQGARRGTPEIRQVDSCHSSRLLVLGNPFRVSRILLPNTRTLLCLKSMCRLQIWTAPYSMSALLWWEAKATPIVVRPAGILRGRKAPRGCGGKWGMSLHTESMAWRWCRMQVASLCIAVNYCMVPAVCNLHRSEPSVALAFYPLRMTAPPPFEEPFWDPALSTSSHLYCCHSLLISFFLPFHIPFIHSPSNYFPPPFLLPEHSLYPKLLVSFRYADAQSHSPRPVCSIHLLRRYLEKTRTFPLCFH